MSKMGTEHYIVHYDQKHYAAFPSLAQVKNDVYVVFRDAPTRKSKTHIDTRSMLVIKRSRDFGQTWQVINQLSLGEYIGVQDPSLHICNNKFTINCFGWQSIERCDTKKLSAVKMVGPYLLSSKDYGQTWTAPQHVLKNISAMQLATSEPIIRDGDTAYLPCYGYTGGGGNAAFLLKSTKTQQKLIRIAHDTTKTFDYEEPALLDCGNKHLLCLLRVPQSDGTKIYQAHSWDAGETWEPVTSTGISGLPPSVVMLENSDVLCTYGYRKKPYGIRACISHDMGLTWNVKDEIILRTDGGGWDIGYPNTVQMSDGTLLTAYYFYTKDDKTRRIELTHWQIVDYL